MARPGRLCHASSARCSQNPRRHNPCRPGADRPLTMVGPGAGYPVGRQPSASVDRTFGPNIGYYSSHGIRDPFRGAAGRIFACPSCVCSLRHRRCFRGRQHHANYQSLGIEPERSYCASWMWRMWASSNKQQRGPREETRANSPEEDSCEVIRNHPFIAHCWGPPCFGKKWQRTRYRGRSSAGIHTGACRFASAV
jgi:hypothetical protein